MHTLLGILLMTIFIGCAHTPKSAREPAEFFDLKGIYHNSNPIPSAIVAVSFEMNEPPRCMRMREFVVAGQSHNRHRIKRIAATMGATHVVTRLFEDNKTVVNTYMCDYKEWNRTQREWLRQRAIHELLRRHKARGRDLASFEYLGKMLPIIKWDIYR